MTEIPPEIAALRERARWLEQRLDEEIHSNRQMRESLAWRLTHPLRDAGRLARALLRRLPKLRRRGGQRATATPVADLKQAYRQRLRAELDCFLASDATLSLGTGTTPQVSIVLVLYNQAELSFACLRSLASITLPYELIIVDNACQDATAKLLARISGAKICTQSENLGFLKAVNLAWPQAKGEFVLLLNNDAQLLPGALECLSATLHADPGAAGVGGKILLLDGSLQEAGSIVWQDGSCLGYGRGDDPCAPEYQFRRAVDYVSGAFLLLRRTQVAQLGVFDLAYAPAYYEETDLCLRLRAAGWRILYEPAATLLHFEFGSSARSDEALNLQRRNQTRFQAKHAATLQAHHLPAAPSDPAVLRLARFSERGRQRVLVLDDRLPDPDLGAGFPRARQILLSLHALGAQVTFYPVKVPHADWATVYRCLPREIEVILGAGETGLGAFLAQRRGYFQAVIVSRPHNMTLVQTHLQTQPKLLATAKLIYDAEAIFARRERLRHTLHTGTPATGADAAEARELALAQTAAVVLAVSPAEAAVYRAAGAAQVQVLGHALSLTPTPAAFAARAGLLFVGALHHAQTPNADSVRWLVREIMPKVTALLGSAVPLTIVGHNAVPELLELASDTVHFTGRVADLTPYFNQARLFVAPTRYASGIPHKAHEAAAHGLPLVTTTLLAQQLGWQAGVDLLCAEATDSDGYAAAVARLYLDAGLWQTLRDNALQRVAQDCSPDAFREVLRAVLADA